VALRTFWCVLHEKKKTIFGKVFWDQVHQFSSALDIEVGYTVQAAFLNGLHQHAGWDADPSQYLMTVYDTQGGTVRLTDFTAPADASTGPAGDTLRGFSDEDLIAEPGRRLRQR